MIDSDKREFGGWWIWALGLVILTVVVSTGQLELEVA